MYSYIARRLLLIIPTLIIIMVVNFGIIQFAPGGPVDRLVWEMRSGETNIDSGFATSRSGEATAAQPSNLMTDATRGIDAELLEQIKKHYGFDKPAWQRMLDMFAKYSCASLLFPQYYPDAKCPDLGGSFFQDKGVWQLIVEKLPVSISLGLWSTLIIYLISIPLGIRKALTDGSNFDLGTSFIIIIGYAVPSFMFALIFITLFAGGGFWQIFPIRGLWSEGIENASTLEQVKDYFWHLALPIAAMVIGGFASLTMLTKNSFLDEIGKQYVITAKAKGLTQRKVLFKHVFRNAMLIVIAGFPAALLGIFFTGSLLIENIFALDGLGRLGFRAAIARDYPIVFGTLFIFTLVGLLLSLIRDITYVLIDPRINFDRN